MDVYLWIGNVPIAGLTRGGAEPSVKFLEDNIHTMDELILMGNFMKGSQPLLTFDGSFGEREELRLCKCLLEDVFGTPRGHPKNKPFVDRVMAFYYGSFSTLFVSFVDFSAARRCFGTGRM